MNKKQMLVNYPLSLRALEFRVCTDVSSEADIRDDICSEQIVESICIGIKRWIQFVLKCHVHNFCKIA